GTLRVPSPLPTSRSSHGTRSVPATFWKSDDPRPRSHRGRPRGRGRGPAGTAGRRTRRPTVRTARARRTPPPHVTLPQLARTRGRGRAARGAGRGRRRGAPRTDPRPRRGAGPVGRTGRAVRPAAGVRRGVAGGA